MLWRCTSICGATVNHLLHHVQLLKCIYSSGLRMNMQGSKKDKEEFATVKDTAMCG